jgi:hypothetical protein
LRRQRVGDAQLNEEFTTGIWTGPGAGQAQGYVKTLGGQGHGCIRTSGKGCKVPDLRRMGWAGWRGRREYSTAQEQFLSLRARKGLWRWG